MDKYRERDDKLALAVSSTMAAKEAAVDQFGLGEELSFTLFGWADDNLAIVANLSQEFMLEPPNVRVERVKIAAEMMRKGWGIDEITFLAEAFCSTDLERTQGRDLREVFLEKDSPVYECVTLTHVSSDGVEIVSVPYALRLGGFVEWFDPIRNRHANGLRDSAYPKVLSDALKVKLPVHPDDMDVYHSILAGGLMAKGFTCQYNF